ncbi:thioredoxin family protein [Oceanobacillus sp. CAU 1775]
MQEISTEELQSGNYILFIYTPFCGTCSVARAMLENIEAIHKQTIFYEMNANFEEEFMHEHKVEQVPCLFIMENHEVKEKVYTLHSTGNIYRYLLKYKPELFSQV